MSNDFKSQIGFDPLAWMGDDRKEEGMSDSELNVDVLESSFNALAPQASELATRFYDELFKRHPAVVPMFEGTTKEQQAQKLVAALSTVISQLRQPEQLVATLKGLGANHQRYGAQADHFSAVAVVLLDVMKDMAGDLWTPEVETAWTNALNTVAGIMLGAYQTNDAPAVASGQTETENQVGNTMSNEIVGDIEILKDILENVPVNVMIADLDENIVFVNQRAKEVLTEVESELQQYLPNFSVASVAGGSIHRYHKDPQAIKNILQGLRPGESRKGEITPGHFVFEHETRPIVDKSGNKLGYVVQWHDVTERRKQEEDAARLQTAIDGAQTAMMTIDRDLVITYVNESTRILLQGYEADLKALYPSFNVSTVIGTCIDIFHKDPAHQRRILDNPANLPYETDIAVGPLTFHIRAAAMNDLSGNYVGNTLEWSDVTELRKKEEDTFRLQRAIDGAQTAIMMIDRDLVITYANESTLRLLKENESELRSIYPMFNIADAVGACIDIFHKDPSYQRKILDDPRNLPYSADIHVGSLTFNINVGAMNDLDGNYIGNTLEWSDVTELRKKEIEVARLTSAVDGAAANIMLCDEDLNVIYANPAVVNMMGRREGELRKVFAGFDSKNLKGQCIDQFHKNPAHQRALLSDMSRLPAKAEMEVGGLEFQVNATAIVGPNGEWMGNMVQWDDITEQKDAERQIESLIDSASSGELEQRIKVDDYEGFLRGLGESINSLIDAVVTPIRENTRVVQALADGDLRETMTGEFEGEFATMRDAINQSVGNLKNMVSQIQNTTGNITSAAAEIAQGNADLSQRTEEQASSLEETASSMEELTSTVKQNADNARQANQLATGAREQAEKGGDVVQRAVSAMAEINSSSKKIADIIGVIDEIAFQTNLLALNAAVEAARAGEQGRGFAVVAGEVRNLAQRSAGAAKEIKSLIQDSVEKVEDGSKLVDQSGTTLDEIVGAVKKVSDIIAEIAAASQEQSSGIEQVNKAVTQMDEVTQQNAALVEQAAAASESMDEQAKGLLSLMGFFKTDEAAGAGGVSNVGQAPMSAQPAAAPARARAAAPAAAPRARPAASSDDSEWEEF